MRSASPIALARAASPSIIAIAPNLSPPSLASVSPGLRSRAARRGAVNSAESPNDIPIESLTGTTVDVHHDHQRPRRTGPARLDERRLQPVEEQFAIRQARQIVVDRVVQDAFLGLFAFSDVGKRANDPNDLALRADHRTRLQGGRGIVAVAAAQTDVVLDTAGALMQQTVERRDVTVAIQRMQYVQPARGRDVERPAVKSEFI